MTFKILITSVNIADAVSSDPAPRPITVTSPAKSVLMVAMFNVPPISYALPFLTKRGDTFKVSSETSAIYPVY